VGTSENHWKLAEWILPLVPPSFAARMENHAIGFRVRSLGPVAQIGFGHHLTMGYSDAHYNYLISQVLTYRQPQGIGP